MRPLLLALVVVAAACGSGGDGPAEVTVSGVVVDVQGDLSSVEAFTIRTGGGDDLVFTPGPDVTFDGGPLSHVRSHLVSGEPVKVTYETSASGELVAVVVEDG